MAGGAPEGVEAALPHPVIAAGRAGGLGARAGGQAPRHELALDPPRAVAREEDGHPRVRLHAARVGEPARDPGAAEAARAGERGPGPEAERGGQRCRVAAGAAETLGEGPAALAETLDGQLGRLVRGPVLQAKGRERLLREALAPPEDLEARRGIRERPVDGAEGKRSLVEPHAAGSAHPLARIGRARLEDLHAADRDLELAREVRAELERALVLAHLDEARPDRLEGAGREPRVRAPGRGRSALVEEAERGPRLDGDDALFTGEGAQLEDEALQEVVIGFPSPGKSEQESESGRHAPARPQEPTWERATGIRRRAIIPAELRSSWLPWPEALPVPSVR